GVECGVPRVDFKAIVARKDAVVRQWREGIQSRLEGARDHLRVVHGHARFTGEREIEAAGERHRAEIFVIDVGVRPATPEIEGLAAFPWLDNRRVMELVAVGRRPNTDDLGCERAGIGLDGRGFIKVDDRYRTSAEGIYAVGDVTGGPQFTHTAWDDHRILFDVLTGRSARSRSGRVIPYVVFTDPQVAGVGLNEREARARGVRFDVAKMPFGQVARAIEIDETAGLLKLLVDPQTERIVGANIVGAEAGELIHVDRKSTRLNSSHVAISYAVFCLKKK